MVILTWIALLSGGTAYSFSAKYNIQPLIINAADMGTFIVKGGILPHSSNCIPGHCTFITFYNSDSCYSF
jgi:hypothetical protein